MTIRKAILTFALSTSVTMLLQCCFTGVESTPRITDNDVTRQKIIVSPEMKFMDYVASQPFGEWSDGKEFYVTDDKIGIVLTQPDQSIKISTGDTIHYLRSRNAKTITGESATDLIFARKGSPIEFSYRIPFPIEALSTKPVSIPFTVESSIIDSVRQLMTGNTYYVITPIWYSIDGHAITGRRFIPVKITDVRPGNHIYPVKIVFTDDTDSEACVLMSIGNENLSTRGFSDLFAFDNPRNRYPSITDINWERIIRSEIALEMTRDECRLALGAPKEIDRHPSTGGLLEIWNYDDGQYLVFLDGILTRYRQ